MPKFYVTKYALSSGVVEMDLNVTFGTSSVEYLRGGNWASFVRGRDAFENRDDAVKAANAARVKKIASLQKQIKKLEKLTFDDI